MGERIQDPCGWTDVVVELPSQLWGRVLEVCGASEMSAVRKECGSCAWEGNRWFIHGR